MPLKPLDFKPGIVRDDTQYRAEGSWWDCDKVRFRDGRPEMIGGWVARNATALTGTVRGLHRMLTSFDNNTVIAGTESGLYQAIDSGGAIVFQNITPDSYAVVLGSNPLEITGPNFAKLTVPDLFKFSVGDTVVLAGLTTFGGNSAGVLNSSYFVTALTGSVVSLAPVALGSLVAAAAGGGSSGTVSVTFAARTATVQSIVGARYWSFATLDGALLSCERNGPIYYWDGGSSPSFYLRNAASLYSPRSCPSVAICIGIGQDRSIIAFGCNDPQIPIDSTTLLYGLPFKINRTLVTWSDSSNPFDWEDREDNTAGTLSIQYGTEIITVVPTRREHLIFMDSCLMSMKYIGDPDYYGIDKIADNITIIGPNAAMAVGDTVFFMGPNNFYVYNGAIQPIPCPVARYVFSNINRGQDPAVPGPNTPMAYRVATCHNVEYNEVWWFYPSGSSTENDRYVAYNYVEKTWFIGALARTAALPTEATYPLMAGTDGKLYKHEYLYADNDGATANNISAYIESGDMDIGDGDAFTSISRAIPDHSLTGNTSASVTYQLKKRNAPMAPWEAGTGEKTVAYNEDQVDLRARARQFAFRVASSTNDTKWTLGRPRLDIQQDGKK